MENCIAAIATALAPAGLGVVRLSGKDAIKIADRFFKSFKKLESLKGYEATYGKIFEGDHVLDDVVALVFRAPNSYTGEDVVEISCHGGLLILERILKLCFKNGATPAKRGEFSKRAFLNGKISLTEAEAVMDVVSANSSLFLKAANSVKNGELNKKSKAVLDELIKIDANIAVYLDYPEEDIEEINTEELSLKILKEKEKLEQILKYCKMESLIKNGVNVSIVGKPNVGKSTLMNKICGEEKSIVTKIEGTTRDVLKHSVEIEGINFNFYDTAGIRKTENEIEKIGILKAIKTLKEADVILFVVDEKAKEEDINILKDNKYAKVVLVYNKTDLKYLKTKFKNYEFNLTLETSSKDEKSIENLKKQLVNLEKKDCFEDKDTILILNERQKKAIKNAVKSLDETLKILKNECLLDAAGVELESAIEFLLELTGEKVSEVVVEEIFSKFCVGK